VATPTASPKVGFLCSLLRLSVLRPWSLLVFLRSPRQPSHGSSGHLPPLSVTVTLSSQALHPLTCSVLNRQHQRGDLFSAGCRPPGVGACNVTFLETSPNPHPHDLNALTACALERWDLEACAWPSYLPPRDSRISSPSRNIVLSSTHAESLVGVPEDGSQGRAFSSHALLSPEKLYFLY
jgi:hypothetical protein